MPADPRDPPRVSGGGLPPLPADLDPRGRHRTTTGPGSGRRALLFAGRGIAALVSAALLTGFGAGWFEYHSVNAGLNRLNIFGGSISKPTHDIDGRDQNILIVGNDDRQTATDAELAQLHTGRDGGSLNTDTMMIVHVPANGAKATLLSLPRDSYVAIPGNGMNKLNAAYVFGYNAASGDPNAKRAAGAKLLVSTIQDLTGLTIDHFVQVDLLGFYRISNAIGGVSVNMCAAVAEPDSGINLHKGINVIKGTQALAFVRQRYNFPNGLGDLDRVERQRYFLTAAFRKLTSAGVLLNPVKLQNLFNAVKSSLYMDSGLDPLQLASQLVNLSADSIVGQTIPTDGFANESVGSVVVVSPSEIKAFVNKLIAPTDAKLASSPAVAPSSMTVDVLNAGSGVNLAAATNAQVLQSQGFQIGTVNSAAASTSTVIEYADGMQGQAKTLAAYVPGATYLKVGSLAHVTLLLGADGLTAIKKVSPPSSAATSTPPTTPATPKPKAIDSGCIN
ncbi:MAG: LCP family protein [Actinomycetota bacterium]|nr:LCP family protein [Actinomycetota bacterium]